MNAKEKELRKIVSEMIDDSAKQAKGEVLDRIFKSGCIDVESWQPDNAPMHLPKCIVVALLNHEAEQYSARGTSFEKRQKKEVKNISYFI